MFAAPLRVAALLALLASFALTGASFAHDPNDSSDPWANLRTQDMITIVVTDSGLGGLSVVAEAERRLRTHGVFAEVELIFCNALFTAEGGYNSLPVRDDKVLVFSRALQGMQDHYAPDIILIACNTLSVLYRDTEFAATTETPVIGIVEDGVDLIADRMRTDDSARTIIFATETTVDEGTHKAALLQRNLPAERILTPPVRQLQLHPLRLLPCCLAKRICRPRRRRHGFSQPQPDDDRLSDPGGEAQPARGGYGADKSRLDG